MTSALSATFGGVTVGSAQPGGISWWAVVLESFSLRLFPEVGFGAVLQPSALTLTPDIGMTVVSNVSAGFDMPFSLQLGVGLPRYELSLSPAMAFTATYTYGPEMVGLKFTLRFGMQTVPAYPGRQFDTAVSRAATF